MELDLWRLSLGAAVSFSVAHGAVVLARGCGRRERRAANDFRFDATYDASRGRSLTGSPEVVGGEGAVRRLIWRLSLQVLLP